jgi:hypothetical protein
MKDGIVWIWGGFLYLLAVLNDIIRFKLIFLLPLFLLYTAYKSVVVLKRKRKA